MKTIILIILFFAPCITHSQWYQLYSGFTGYFYDVYFINNATGFVTAPEYVFKSTNGGENWNIIWHYPLHIFRGIYFINTNTGFVLEDSRIFKTTNAGNNWFLVYTTSDGLGLDEIDFPDSLYGYSVGGLSGWGKFVKTTDGGISWFELNPGGAYWSQELYCVDFINRNTGYFGGGGWFNPAHSVIFKTTNGGVNFVERTLVGGLNHIVNGISICNSDSGYATVNDRICLITTNGGAYWNGQIQPSYLSDVFAINFDTVYIIGVNNGFISRTINAGLTWETQQSNTTAPLTKIVFIGRDTGYIVGGYGTILKTTNGGVIGVEPVSNQIPKEFRLYQNYPNPFNPVTKLNYDLPIHSYVNLSVFDILGRVIAVLVNKKQAAGKYEIEWNGTNYPSGIYFYSLTTDKFIDSKIMILIK